MMSLSVHLWSKIIIKNCEACSLKFICDGIDGLADDYIKKTTKVVSSFTL